MKKFQPGKLKGLKNISDNGLIYIAAMDHRSSLDKIFNRKLDFNEMRAIKKTMAKNLSAEASAVLLDPNYGIGLDQGKGLVMSLESTGTSLNVNGHKETLFLRKWGVDKIKKVGASAVKLVLYIDMGDKLQVRKNIALVKKISGECIKHDILFLLEPIASTKDTTKRPPQILSSIKLFSRLGPDIMKVEYPGKDYIAKLNSYCKVPWVLLSGGVEYKKFKEALEISCKNGCSGFVAGRALWDEIAVYHNKGELEDYFSVTVNKRLRELRKITKKFGQSLWVRTKNQEIKSSDWYTNY